jgi:hypothetical protein
MVSIGITSNIYDFIGASSSTILIILDDIMKLLLATVMSLAVRSMLVYDPHFQGSRVWKLKPAFQYRCCLNKIYNRATCE